MSAQIRIVGKQTRVPPKRGQEVVDTTAHANVWYRDLSPFHLGPCYLYGEFSAERMENAWQFAKVYPQHLSQKRVGWSLQVSQEYWTWAQKGWADFKAHRYPMGKGKKPAFSLWDGERLGYIEARKAIYAPLYAEAVQKTKGWERLKSMFEENETLVLRDYDGYDHVSIDMTLTDVLNCPHKIMGHAFVLAMLLLGDEALSQIELRNT